MHAQRVTEPRIRLTMDDAEAHALADAVSAIEDRPLGSVTFAAAMDALRELRSALLSATL
jgi:hypothetical protein